jgi:hypothetical protein
LNVKADSGISDIFEYLPVLKSKNFKNKSMLKKDTLKSKETIKDPKVTD